MNEVEEVKEPPVCELNHLHWGIKKPPGYFLRQTCPNCSYYKVWDCCQSCAQFFGKYREDLSNYTNCPGCGDRWKAHQVWSVYGTGVS